MLDVLLPSTDAGVAIQVGVLVLAVATGLWFSRTSKDMRRLVFGLGLLTFSLMTIRAIH